MSGRACKAAICSNQLAAAATTTAETVVGLANEDQQQQIIDVAEEAIHAMNEIAGEVDGNDDD